MLQYLQYPPNPASTHMHLPCVRVMLLCCAGALHAALCVSPIFSGWVGSLGARAVCGEKRVMLWKTKGRRELGHCGLRHVAGSKSQAFSRIRLTWRARENWIILQQPQHSHLKDLMELWCLVEARSSPVHGSGAVTENWMALCSAH